MICKKCGKEIPNQSQFCIYCGTGQTESPSKQAKMPRKLVGVLALMLVLAGIAGVLWASHYRDKTSVRLAESVDSAEDLKNDASTKSDAPVTDFSEEWGEESTPSDIPEDDNALSDFPEEESQYEFSDFPADGEEDELYDFVGEWEAVDGSYPRMTITSLENHQYQIEIVHKYAMWEAVGEYDARKNAILYFDGVYSDWNENFRDWLPQEDERSGWIYYESPDALCWLNSDDDYAQYFIRTGSLFDDTFNDISYREAIEEGWASIWMGVAENVGSDTIMSLQEEAETDPSLYGAEESPWYGITIDGITYEMAERYGWSDEWTAFIERTYAIE